MRIIIDFNIEESAQVMEVLDELVNEYQGREGNNISFQLSIPTQHQDGRLDILKVPD